MRDPGPGAASVPRAGAREWPPALFVTGGILLAVLLAGCGSSGGGTSGTSASLAQPKVIAEVQFKPGGEVQHRTLALDPVPSLYLLAAENGVYQDPSTKPAGTSPVGWTVGPSSARHPLGHLRRVDRATVLIGGELVIGEDELHAGVGLVSKQVVAAGQTTLSVHAFGPAGSLLTIRLWKVGPLAGPPGGPGPGAPNPGKFMNRKLITTEVVDSPDPTTSGATIDATFAVRASDGLESADDRSGSSEQFEWFIRWRWVLKRPGGASVARILEREVPIQPPFDRVVIETDEGPKDYVRIRSSQLFDGLDSAGQRLVAGLHPWRVDAEFWRRKLDAPGPRRAAVLGPGGPGRGGGGPGPSPGALKLVAIAQPVLGSITIVRDETPPSIVITPADGSLVSTGTPTIVVAYSDSQSGVDTSTLEILLDGSPITDRFTIGPSQASLVPQSPLPEGGHLLAVTVSDRAIPANRGHASSQFRIDSVRPVVQAFPAHESVLTDRTPTLLAVYSDASPSSGLDLDSFAAILDGERLVGFTVGPDRATFKVPTASPLTIGSHTVTYEIADRAGNHGAAVSVFTITTTEPAPPQLPTIPQDPCQDPPPVSASSTGSRLAVARPAARPRTLTSVVCGRVVDAIAFRPITRAKVRVVPTPLVTHTDSSGRFEVWVRPGTYEVCVEKPGYAGPVLRTVTVHAGREAAAEVVALTPQGDRSTTVTPDRGGLVQDALGQVSIFFGPDAVWASTAIRVTRHPSPLALPRLPTAGYIEGTGFHVEPHMRLRKPVKVRVRTRARLRSDIPVWVSSFDGADWAWRPLGRAKVLGADQIEFETDHFSHVASFCRAFGLVDDDNFKNFPTYKFNPPECTNETCPADRTHSPVRVGLHEAELVDEQTIPGVLTLGVRRDLVLGYSSETVNIRPHIGMGVRLPPEGVREVTWSVTAGGTTTAAVYGASTLPESYHGFLWSATDAQGQKLPTGSYEYTARATVVPTSGANQETLRSGVVVVRNGRSSPFGAGWWLRGLMRLTTNPDASVLLMLDERRYSHFRPGFISLLLAGAPLTEGFSGDGGPASQARLKNPEGMVFDGAGNLYVADAGNHRVRRTDHQTGNITTVAGNGTAGYSGDGGPATEASLNFPTDVGLDDQGNLYIADFQNQAIRRVDTKGRINTVLGGPGGRLGRVRGLWVSPQGVLTFSEPDKHQVSRLDPGVGPDPVVVAGTTGTLLSRFAGDGGPATEAVLDRPTGVAVSPAGETTIVDVGNNRIRRVDIAGIIQTVAGNGLRTAEAEKAGLSGVDGVSALSVPLLLEPQTRVALDPDGSFSVPNGGFVHRVDPQGVIRIVAGHPRGLEHVTNPAGLREQALVLGTIVPATQLDIGVPMAVARRPSDGALALSDPGPSGSFLGLLVKEHEGFRVYTPQAAETGRLTRRADGAFTYEERDLTRHTFSVDGLLLSSKDPNQNVTTYRYGAGGGLRQIEDPAGKLTEFATDVRGFITSITDPAGRVTALSIDERGDLVTVSGPLGLRTFAYDGEHRMQLDRSPAGREHRVAYECFGRVRTVSEAPGVVTTYFPAVTRELANNLKPGTGTPSAPATLAGTSPIADVVIDPNGHAWFTRTTAAGVEFESFDPLGRHTQKLLTTAGDVGRQKLPSGAEVLFTRNLRRDLLRRHDVVTGAIWVYSSDPATGKVTDVLDPFDARTSTVYDAGQNPIATTDAARNTTTRTFSPRGLLLTVTKPPKTLICNFGNELPEELGPAVTRHEYTDDGNLRLSVDPMGGEVSQVLDARGFVTEQTDERNHKTITTYDDAGRPLTVKAPNGGITKHVYDPDGLLMQTTGPMDEKTILHYDEMGRQDAQTDPNNVTRRTRYDKAGRVVERIDGMGRSTITEYNAAGQILREIRPGNRVVQNFYDSRGLKVATIDPEGHATQFRYDRSGRQVGVIRADGLEATTEYDIAGQVKATVDEAGSRTEYGYDAMGRVFQIVSGMTARGTEPLHAVNFTFDEQGNQITELHAGKDVFKCWGYDRNGRRVRSDIAAGVAGAARFDRTTVKFDRAGNPIEVTNPNGKKTIMTYTVMNQLETETDPNRRTTRSTYDLSGRKETKTDHDGKSTTWTYYPGGRVRTRKARDGKETTWTYDGENNVLTVSDPDTTIKREYDEVNQVSSVEDLKLRRKVTYTYYKDGVRRSYAVNGGTPTLIEVDSLHRPRKITHASGAVVEYEWTPVGRVATKRLPGGITFTARYNRLHRPTFMSYNRSDGTTLWSAELKYDQLFPILTELPGVGRITTVVERSIWSTGPAQVTTYVYDHESQVRQATHPDGSKEIFSMDPQGNITSYERRSGTRFEITSFTFDPADQIEREVTTLHLPPEEPLKPPPPPRVIAHINYTHDDLGGLQSASGTTTATFSYDGQQRLVQVRSVSPSGPSTVSYGYGPDGPLRQSYTDPQGVTRFYHWEDQTQNLLAELDENLAARVEYLDGEEIDEHVARIEGGVIHAYISDWRNGVMAVVDASGTVLNHYGYLTFGGFKEKVETVANRYGFTGREFGDPHGLMNYRARWMNPRWGRFTQIDPAGRVDGLNLYSYVQNRPTVAADPGGLKLFVHGGGNVEFKLLTEEMIRWELLLEPDDELRFEGCEDPPGNGVAFDTVSRAMHASGDIHLHTVSGTDVNWDRWEWAGKSLVDMVDIANLHRAVKAHPDNKHIAHWEDALVHVLAEQTHGVNKRQGRDSAHIFAQREEGRLRMERTVAAELPIINKDPARNEMRVEWGQRIFRARTTFHLQNDLPYKGYRETQLRPR